MERLEAFVHAVEGVDARVTGHPVQTYYASRHIRHSYIRGTLRCRRGRALRFRSLAHSLWPWCRSHWASADVRPHQLADLP
jgi:hypothetical protein